MHPEKLLDRRFNNPSGPPERDICGKWGTTVMNEANIDIYCNDKPENTRGAPHSYKNAKGVVYHMDVKN